MSADTTQTRTIAMLIEMRKQAISGLNHCNDVIASLSEEIASHTRFAKEFELSIVDIDAAIGALKDAPRAEAAPVVMQNAEIKP